MRVNVWTVLAGLVLVLPLFAEAADVIPGGEEARKAVEARRGKTDLSKLAAKMKPGSWAELKTEMPKGLWSSPLVNNGRNNGGRGGLHIAGWTDDAHWDSRTGQFLYMGIRQTRQFISYSEEKNAWRVIALDKTSDNPVFQTAFGHIYGRNAFDPATSRFFHMYNDYKELNGGISFFDVSAEKWIKLPPPPPKGMGMCIEFFSARKGLVSLSRDGVRFFSETEQKWEEWGKVPVCGYHSLARHNPYREEVLLAGGNTSRRTVGRLNKDGKYEPLKDSPVDLNTNSDKITVDPASGRYLILRNSEKKFYEFDSGTNEYRLVDDFATTPWPFKNHEMPVVAFIPEHGVIMFADKSVWLYKHNAPSGLIKEKK